MAEWWAGGLPDCCNDRSGRCGPASHSVGSSRGVGIQQTCVQEVQGWVGLEAAVTGLASSAMRCAWGSTSALSGTRQPRAGLYSGLYLG